VLRKKSRNRMSSAAMLLQLARPLCGLRVLQESSLHRHARPFLDEYSPPGTLCYLGKISDFGKSLYNPISFIPELFPRYASIHFHKKRQRFV